MGEEGFWEPSRHSMWSQGCGCPTVKILDHVLLSQGPGPRFLQLTLPSDLLALTPLPGQARSALEAAAWRQGSSRCRRAALKMSAGHSPAARASAAESLGRFLWGWWSLPKLGVRTRLHAGVAGAEGSILSGPKVPTLVCPPTSSTPLGCGLGPRI